jgi:Na+-driven multidrug efflux pump
MPIIGYNYGAKNKERLLRTFKISMAVAVSIMLLGTVAFQIFARDILGFFSASGEMYRIGVPALKIISLAFLPAAFSIICSVNFQAMGHGMYSLLVSLARQLIGLIPLAFILSHLFGLSGIWWSFPAAEYIGILASGVLIHRIYVKEVSALDSESILTKS